MKNNVYAYETLDNLTNGSVLPSAFSYTSRGRGGLVARYRPRSRSVLGSRPYSTEDPPCMQTCCTINHTKGAKCPPAGVVRNFGEGFQFRCRPRHLTAAQNDEIRPKYSPRVVSERDVNITKLN
ncbi:hypothetical protein AVEN_186645-1 [Araneus ventricosus]|uniref:Uncharacterized protein n=1 Tax=Araneus ventricosus TaxID=182803 RepID=A0A4Y2I0Q2_ARAVE|nr:hypothetical protein AVEN_186645-1 [Araneus ventricosus]